MKERDLKIKRNVTWWEFSPLFPLPFPFCPPRVFSPVRVSLCWFPPQAYLPSPLFREKRWGYVPRLPECCCAGFRKELCIKWCHNLTCSPPSQPGRSIFLFFSSFLSFFFSLLLDCRCACMHSCIWAAWRSMS